MRSQSCVWILLAVILMVLFLGCSTTNRHSLESPTASAVVPVVSPTYDSIPTVVPTATKTVTPPAPTCTPQPMRTPTPTLDRESRVELYRQMLLTNGGCELPCWWGVTPGETTWEEMLAFFGARGVRVGRETRRGDARRVTLVMDGYPEWGIQGIRFLGRDNLVQGVRVWGHVTEERSPVSAAAVPPNDYLAQFDLPHLLLTYGAPSRVYVVGAGSASHSDIFGFYSLVVEYVDLGILVNYSGYTLQDATGYLICLAGNEGKRIQLSLLPPGGTPQDITEIDRELSYWPDTILDWTQLEGLSAQEFYEAFSVTESPSCLRVMDHPWDASHIIEPPTGFSPLLSHDEARIVELLTTNGGCELPCWWGVTPGQTSVQDAQYLFQSYGKAISVCPRSSGETQYKVGLFGRYDAGLLDSTVRHIFSEQDGAVAWIRVVGEPSVWTSSRHLVQDWHRYSLAEVLSRLGPPSQVVLDFKREGCGEAYQLGIVYDELGTLIQFGGKVQRTPDTVVICPRLNEVTRFGLFLTTPGSGLALEEQLSGSSYGCARVRIEDGVGMSVDEFHHIYLDPEAETCLEIPEELGSYCP